MYIYIFFFHMNWQHFSYLTLLTYIVLRECSRCKLCMTLDLYTASVTLTNLSPAAVHLPLSFVFRFLDGIVYLHFVQVQFINKIYLIVWVQFFTNNLNRYDFKSKANYKNLNVLLVRDLKGWKSTDYMTLHIHCTGTHIFSS